MNLLVTGCAGFIGSSVVSRLAPKCIQLLGLDDFNGYYDPALKRARWAISAVEPCIQLVQGDVCDADTVRAAFEKCQPSHVIHLAAQAGAGASISDPSRTVNANLIGFANILEACRYHNVQHLVFASSSSVYGLDRALPFSEHMGADHPITPYGATKRANELMAHSYSHLFSLPCTGLRFFTVYGPWGRPDMVLSKWVPAILKGHPIRVFNRGRSTRDFTYIDDVAEAIMKVLLRPACPNSAFDRHNPDPASSSAPFRLYNVACGQTVPLVRYIEVLEECLGRKAIIQLEPIQSGDVPDTTADVSDFQRDFGFRPSIPVEVGVRRFVEWYRGYHRV